MTAICLSIDEPVEGSSGQLEAATWKRPLRSGHQKEVKSKPSSTFPASEMGSAHQPAHDHDRQTSNEDEEADFVDPVHHAQADACFFVTMKQIHRIEVIKNFLEEHGLRFG